MLFWYIDPGTGSMLFTILIGIISAGFFAFRNLITKLKFLVKNGKKSSLQNESSLEYVIFADSKRYWNMFEPICDEFEKRGINLVYMTASEDDAALEKNYQYISRQFIGNGNKAFVTMNMLKANIVLSTTPGLDVYQWKRSKNVKYYVHITHAVSDTTFYRMFGIDYYDAILISGSYQEEQIRKLENLRNLPAKEIHLVGQPYMDTLKSRLEASPSKHNDNVTVLLAPSWGKSSILNKYGEEFILSLIATGYNIIVRPHPQSFTSEKEMIERMMSKFPENEKFEWNRDNDNFEVLRKSDILISDFSGVLFDFSLAFDKPVIYADTSFDSSPYDACWLDEKDAWCFETLPKIGVQLKREDLPNIRNVIDSCIESTEFQLHRDKIRSEAWAYQGKSACCVVDYLIKKNKELSELENSLDE